MFVCLSIVFIYLPVLPPKEILILTVTLKGWQNYNNGQNVLSLLIFYYLNKYISLVEKKYLHIQIPLENHEKWFYCR